MRVGALLDEHVRRLGLGTVLSFISAARLPPDQIPEAFIPGAPDLTVEIISPGSRWSEVEEKVADYLGGGSDTTPSARKIRRPAPPKRKRAVCASITRSRRIDFSVLLPAATA